MTSADYKKPRKLDFPQCAKDALIRIGECTPFFEFVENRIPTTFNVLMVICEFFFRESVYEQKKSGSLL